MPRRKQICPKRMKCLEDGSEGKDDNIVNTDNPDAMSDGSGSSSEASSSDEDTNIDDAEEILKSPESDHTSLASIGDESSLEVNKTSGLNNNIEEKSMVDESKMDVKSPSALSDSKDNDITQNEDTESKSKIENTKENVPHDAMDDENEQLEKTLKRKSNSPPEFNRDDNASPRSPRMHVDKKDMGSPSAPTLPLPDSESYLAVLSKFAKYSNFLPNEKESSPSKNLKDLHSKYIDDYTPIDEDQPLDLSKPKSNSDIPTKKIVPNHSKPTTNTGSSLATLEKKFGGNFEIEGLTPRASRYGSDPSRRYYDLSSTNLPSYDFSKQFLTAMSYQPRKPSNHSNHTSTPVPPSKIVPHSKVTPYKNGLDHKTSHHLASSQIDEKMLQKSFKPKLPSTTGPHNHNGKPNMRDIDMEKRPGDPAKYTDFICSCMKKFHSLYGLTMHMQDTGHAPSSSKNTAYLEYPKLVRGQDMWLNHGSEQTRQILRCMKCGESFKSLPELTVHMMQTGHYANIVSTEGKKVHKCSTYCERCEDSECVFKCKVCQEVYSDMEGLANHMVISGHHKKQVLKSNSVNISEQTLKSKHISTLSKIDLLKSETMSKFEAMSSRYDPLLRRSSSSRAELPRRSTTPPSLDSIPPRKYNPEDRKPYPHKYAEDRRASYPRNHEERSRNEPMRLSQSPGNEGRYERERESPPRVSSSRGQELIADRRSRHSVDDIKREKLIGEPQVLYNNDKEDSTLSSLLKYKKLLVKEERERLENSAEKDPDNSEKDDDIKVTCESCGDKIDTSVFVEHVRLCVKTKSKVIDALRARLKSIESNCTSPTGSSANDTIKSPCSTPELASDSKASIESHSENNRKRSASEYDSRSTPSPLLDHKKTMNKKFKYLTPNEKDRTSPKSSKGPSALAAMESFIEKSFMEPPKKMGKYYVDPSEKYRNAFSMFPLGSLYPRDKDMDIPRHSNRGSVIYKEERGTVQAMKPKIHIKSEHSERSMSSMNGIEDGDKPLNLADGVKHENDTSNDSDNSKIEKLEDKYLRDDDDFKSSKAEDQKEKYLNSPGSGSNGDGSALESLKGLVYGQHLNTEHPLDSLQRLITHPDQLKSGGVHPGDQAVMLMNPSMLHSPHSNTSHDGKSPSPLDDDRGPPESPSGEKNQSDSDSDTHGDFRCQACSRQFASKGSYRYHLSRCHLTSVKKYGIKEAFNMSPYIYLPLDHNAKFSKYYKMAKELTSKAK
ncbi:unnamed protein product [Owenia fusiformis]|uniref:C2H2-type domain-containing protein n=1 Tax=Owenia fusiformis TaxID=6347 RepID=A0A8S4ND51_OWEFU|nr:unnamed protein product [Owenia fusiformis]